LQQWLRALNFGIMMGIKNWTKIVLILAKKGFFAFKISKFLAKNTEMVKIY
jgi:hypothetical protein